MHWIHHRSVLVLAVLSLAVLGACSDDDGENVRNLDPSASGSGSGSGSGTGSGTGSGSAPAACEPVGDPSGADTTVAVTLREYDVEVDPSSVPAGSVHLAIENIGAEAHEVVVVRADAPGDVPTDADGHVDEEALGDDLVGEVEAFPAGETCDGVFELDAGTYQLLCAVVEDHEGEEVDHFAEGMVATLTVG